MNIDKKSNTQKDLRPISRVILMALMEKCVTKEGKNNAVEFLLEAERCWKNEHPEKTYKHPGAYYLGRTYQNLEKQKILSQNGIVVNPKALYSTQQLNGRLCRPRGFSPINYQQSKAIIALVSQSELFHEYQNR